MNRWMILFQHNNTQNTSCITPYKRLFLLFFHNGHISLGIQVQKNQFSIMYKVKTLNL